MVYGKVGAGRITDSHWDRVSTRHPFFRYFLFFLHTKKVQSKFYLCTLKKWALAVKSLVISMSFRPYCRLLILSRNGI